MCPLTTPPRRIALLSLSPLLLLLADTERCAHAFPSPPLPAATKQSPSSSSSALDSYRDPRNDRGGGNGGFKFPDIFGGGGDNDRNRRPLSRPVTPRSLVEPIEVSRGNVRLMSGRRYSNDDYDDELARQRMEVERGTYNNNLRNVNGGGRRPVPPKDFNTMRRGDIDAPSSSDPRWNQVQSQMRRQQQLQEQQLQQQQQQQRGLVSLSLRDIAVNNDENFEDRQISRGIRSGDEYTNNQNVYNDDNSNRGERGYYPGNNNRPMDNMDNRNGPGRGRQSNNNMENFNRSGRNVDNGSNYNNYANNNNNNNGRQYRVRSDSLGRRRNNNDNFNGVNNDYQSRVRSESLSRRDDRVRSESLSRRNNYYEEDRGFTVTSAKESVLQYGALFQTSFVGGFTGAWAVFPFVAYHFLFYKNDANLSLAYAQVQWETIAAILQGAAFAILYRYAIRDNGLYDPKLQAMIYVPAAALKSFVRVEVPKECAVAAKKVAGTVAGKASEKAVAQVAGTQFQCPVTDSISILNKGMTSELLLNFGEALALFGVAALVMNYCLERRWIRPYV